MAKPGRSKDTMIYTRFGSEVEILSLVDIGRRDVYCQVKRGDGSSAKRAVAISDLKATGGIAEIQNVIQRITGVRPNG